MLAMAMSNCDCSRSHCGGILGRGCGSGSTLLEVDEPELEAFNFGLHPNPANDIANVQLENALGSQLTLYSPTGELILRQKTTSQITRLDLTDLATAIYLVEVVNTEGSRATKRVTVVN